MFFDTVKGIFIPFIGTVLGSACVFFLRGALNHRVKISLLGFAAGVMTAASVWSLIIPAIELSESLGALSFFPAVAGFWIGVLFLLILDRVITRSNSEEKSSMLAFAVVLHNLPEGMAVGVIYAGLLSGNAGVTVAGALALSLGIAIQNFPEGAIISMPLASEGKTKSKAFISGALSGIVEPIGAALTILAASFVTPILPYFLSFAAGAMIYVVITELVPQISEGNHASLGTVMFAAGFTVMMALDVALG
ncbi:MAG: ZIP family metal transporter [Clostridia bacterium]|nr:ZIP family metal transporter [Clostridia bacterium]